MVSSGITVCRTVSIDEQHSLPARWWPLGVDGRSHKINFVLQTLRLFDPMRSDIKYMHLPADHYAKLSVGMGLKASSPSL